VAAKFVALVKPLKKVYLAPGIALDESHPDFQKKNLEGFNIFLEKNLKNFSNSYDSQKWISFYNEMKNHPLFLNTHAVLLTAHYIKKYHTSLSAIEKFKKFIDILQENKVLQDGIVTTVALYAFISEKQTKNSNIDKISRDLIIDNFFKKGSKIIKNSRNAAHDITYIRAVSELHNQESSYKKNKIESWFLTADKGLQALCESISFHEKKNTPLMRLNYGNDNNDIKEYFHECLCYLYNSLGKKDIDLDITSANANRLIEDLKSKIALEQRK